MTITSMRYPHIRGQLLRLGVVLLAFAARPAAGDDPPAPAPAPAAGECKRLPAAASVETPERDLFRVEKISDALKRVTMGRICKAIESGQLDDVAAVFAPQASS